MTWATLADLIIEVGWPMAQKIAQKVESAANVTAADLAELDAMSQQKAKDRMLAQLIAAKIDPTSPQGVAMLALAQ